jgi:hypothetical protein
MIAINIEKYPIIKPIISPLNEDILDEIDI